jgi:hypothetical protein
MYFRLTGVSLIWNFVRTIHLFSHSEYYVRGNNYKILLEHGEKYVADFLIEHHD